MREHNQKLATRLMDLEREFHELRSQFRNLLRNLHKERKHV